MKQTKEDRLLAEAYFKIKENASPLDINPNDYTYYNDDYKVLGTSYLVAANFDYAQEATGHQAGYHGGAIKGRDIYHNMAQNVTELVVVDDHNRPVTDEKLLNDISAHVLQTQREKDLEGPHEYGELS